MKKRQLKKRSKRTSLSQKYKIQKKVREHHRKLRKEARKAKNAGGAVKKNTRTTRIPNTYPHKMQIMEEEELSKEIEILKKNNKAADINESDLEKLIEKEDGGKQAIMNQTDLTPNRKDSTKSKKDMKGELNSLINNSHVVLEVLDARDPQSFRSKEFENNVKTAKKKLIIILNKVDLVSKENAANWATFFRKEHPTILFSSKQKGSCIEELLNLVGHITGQNLQRIVVSVVGYPNTGKSSLISTIKPLNVLSTPSSTIKGNNEFIVNKNIVFFEYPGFIYSQNETGSLMPKSHKDMGDLKNPIGVLQNLLTIISPLKLVEHYEIPEFENISEFLEHIAKKYNLLIKKGYTDIERAARHILKDLVEGRLKYQTEIEA